jgi:cytochrome c oxidase cbb3-type subunit III
MSSEKKTERLLEHDYDGIQEYDNPTPKWWTWIFWGSVAFSLAYWWNPAGVFRGPGRIPEYEVAMAAAAALVSDPAALALGKTTFATTCAACHRPDAGGQIGPNLTDEYWLHGGNITDVFKTVSTGVLEKGMPPWEKTLKPEQLRAVTAYVVSLAGSRPPNPKEPQGTKIAPDGR